MSSSPAAVHSQPPARGADFSVENSARNTPWWLIVLGLLWLVGFSTVFYGFDLPNSGTGPDDRVPRIRIWEQLPLLILNNIDPPEPLPDNPGELQLWRQSGWSKIPQRFPLWGVSLLILTGAWAWGHLFLRCLRLPLSDPPSRCVLALGCGLSGVSTATLILGRCGLLSRSLCSAILIVGIILELMLRAFLWRSEPENIALPTDAPRDPRAPLPRLTPFAFRSLWLALIPFAMCYVGGASLPEIDFDVKEYHFGGPKEWYLAGQIEFLPHNVYTSFPFLSEMLVLLGMVLYGDWYWGAIAGKGVLMAFAPLTALGIYAIGRRWFSPAVGMWGALIHLSTPWIYRISIIAYAEGSLTFYLLATLLAVLLSGDFPSQRRWTLLVGLLGGSAMACKYPGLISVVLPLGVLAIWGTRWLAADHSELSGQTDHTVTKAASTSPPLVIQWRGRLVLVGLGLSLSIGPWLVKNLWETGNPVYPLAYGVFGGTDWSPELDAKWKRAHSSDHYRLDDLAIKLMDVTLKADWQSPLAFGLAPLVWLWGRRSRRWLYMGLCLYVVFLFGTWWLLTHRLDRFWVPLIPVTSLLAGIAVGELHSRWGSKVLAAFCGFAMLFNWAFMTTSLCGYNAYRLDLEQAAQTTARITSPECVQLNQMLPPDSRVLCVGEAELFDARFPYIYNTVFDVSIFEEWCGVDSQETPAGEKSLRSTAEIRERFRSAGITHVLVNWQEILRYRLSYGYTDFVAPQRFQELQERGILGEAWTKSQSPALGLADERQLTELKLWGPELLRPQVNAAAYETFTVYPVVP